MTCRPTCLAVATFSHIFAVKCQHISTLGGGGHPTFDSFSYMAALFSFLVFNLFLTLFLATLVLNKSGGGTERYVSSPGLKAGGGRPPCPPAANSFFPNDIAVAPPTMSVNHIRACVTARS